jgi:hypothetical protein
MIAIAERLPAPALIGDRAIAWRDYCLRTHHDGAPAGRQIGWLDAQRDFGAVGDGIADDSDALQQGLDQLGSGKERVLHLPAGTYRISRTLHLDSCSTVAVFGDDPGTSTVVYDGPPGQPMLCCRDAGYVRIGHIAWDGRNRASAAVDHVWSRPSRSTWIEHVDEAFCGTADQLAGGRLVPLPGRCALIPWH